MSRDEKMNFRHPVSDQGGPSRLVDSCPTKPLQRISHQLPQELNYQPWNDAEKYRPYQLGSGIYPYPKPQGPDKIYCPVPRRVSGSSPKKRTGTDTGSVEDNVHHSKPVAQVLGSRLLDGVRQALEPINPGHRAKPGKPAKKFPSLPTTTFGPTYQVANLDSTRKNQQEPKVPLPEELESVSGLSNDFMARHRELRLCHNGVLESTVEFYYTCWIDKPFTAVLGHIENVYGPSRPVLDGIEYWKNQFSRAFPASVQYLMRNILIKLHGKFMSQIHSRCILQNGSMTNVNGIAEPLTSKAFLRVFFREFFEDLFSQRLPVLSQIQTLIWAHYPTLNPEFLPYSVRTAIGNVIFELMNQLITVNGCSVIKSLVDAASTFGLLQADNDTADQLLAATSKDAKPWTISLPGFHVYYPLTPNSGRCSDGDTARTAGLKARNGVNGDVRDHEAHLKNEKTVHAVLESMCLNQKKILEEHEKRFQDRVNVFQNQVKEFNKTMEQILKDRCMEATNNESTTDDDDSCFVEQKKQIEDIKKALEKGKGKPLPAVKSLTKTPLGHDSQASGTAQTGTSTKTSGESNTQDSDFGVTGSADFQSARGTTKSSVSASDNGGTKSKDDSQFSSSQSGPSENSISRVFNRIRSIRRQNQRARDYSGLEANQTMFGGVSEWRDSNDDDDWGLSMDEHASNDEGESFGMGTRSKA
ncbi:hypothetical protein PFICI_04603 [Pestalotiopsis fici W106-1]|uniref:Uncharacterized protein n=1 Tax=Pestalotiopsis fici (strain W106-1 / CGMCC3.15140) TaxID=1229662 RepID=W3XBD3_PESFW|nr:uncharacterized protein PFICI_04603 [Pestalotiopsis fici W106-1]ETS82727.1 hypothetical protein PFICI_04603 [Pestalotiopsis fici W106-1]